MITKNLGCLAVALLAGPMAANAASITRTYQGEVSGFTATGSLGDLGLIAPYPTVTFAFTLTFDPLISTGSGAAPVDMYTGTLALPDFGPWVYKYNASTKEMAIGDNCLGSISFCSFTLSVKDAIFYLDLTDLDNARILLMTFRATGTDPNTGNLRTGTFQTRTGTIDGTNGTSVPEPGTLALLGLGLVGLGVSRRKKAV